MDGTLGSTTRFAIGLFVRHNNTKFDSVFSRVDFPIFDFAKFGW